MCKNSTSLSISDFFNQLHMLFSLEVHRFPSGKRPRPAVSMRAVEVLAQSMLQCLQQLDEFLGSSPHFLLGKWLADARASAVAAGGMCPHDIVRCPPSFVLTRKHLFHGLTHCYSFQRRHHGIDAALQEYF